MVKPQSFPPPAPQADAAEARFDFVKPFFQLSAINIVSNLMVPLAGLNDTASLVHLDDSRHLGGVAFVAVLFNYY